MIGRHEYCHGGAPYLAVVADVEGKHRPHVQGGAFVRELVPYDVVAVQARVGGDGQQLAGMRREAKVAKGTPRARDLGDLRRVTVEGQCVQTRGRGCCKARERGAIYLVHGV